MNRTTGPLHRRTTPARAVGRRLSRDEIVKRAAGAFIVAALALAAAAARDAHATTYKWVDEKGIVHYADKMPVEAVNRGHVELDRQGLQVRKQEAAMSPEQVRARAVELQKQSKAAKEREEMERRDNALVSSYSKEEDIDIARSRALTTVDGQLQSARVYAASLTKRQSELVERKQSAGGKPVPVAVERELESIDGELAKTNALINAKKQESLAIAAKYDADKVRYRELRASVGQAESAGKPISMPATQIGGTTANVIPTATNK